MSTTHNTPEGDPLGLRKLAALEARLADADEFDEVFDEYVRLGDRAAGVLPEFHAVVVADEKLSARVAELRKIAADWEPRFAAAATAAVVNKTVNEVLSKYVAEAVSSRVEESDWARVRLVAGRGVWNLVSGGESRQVQAGDVWADSGRFAYRVDDVRPVLALAGPPPVLTLSVSVPDGPTVALRINAATPPVWQLVITRGADSPVEMFQVQVFEAERPLTPAVTVFGPAADEGEEFAIPVKDEHQYTLRLRWQAGDEWREASAPLPFPLNPRVKA